MFERILVERHLVHHPRVQSVCRRFPQTPVKAIGRVEDVFGRAKKPYLQKRTGVQLFLGEKRGTLVKLAPPAYGQSGDPHYYFIHAYNCPYECQYCYLQGHFQSPDLVLFVNHEAIGAEIERLAHATPLRQRAWFHAGEYSDSLALSSLTEEWPHYFQLFGRLPRAVLELRTKSANIKVLRRLPPRENVIVSYSLSPRRRAQNTELKVPSLDQRFKAMSALEALGHPLAVHLDPIIYQADFASMYAQFIEELGGAATLAKIRYWSLGVVRFTTHTVRQARQNYPGSDFLAADWIRSADGKVRYPRPMRLWMLNKIKDLLLKKGVSREKIYFCME